ncbi:hypothetical protein BpHYR1_007677 [Brachionus plicatilis]|uniref:Uncharacterized protein n=1 Tax=Brachionus plicatilis TaxID=10195 RepID=A0A3M7QX70_BRAPC|nr:hypothetical protein BpHYR1_007677 [Brachionus plicatilis]
MLRFVVNLKEKKLTSLNKRATARFDIKLTDINFLTIKYSNINLQVNLSRRVSTKWPSSVFEINESFCPQYVY